MVSSIKLLCFISIIFLLNCKETTHEENQSSLCQEIGEPGPCKALIPGFYFDPDSSRCIEFVWGGCQGNQVFSTMEECKLECE